MSHFLRWPLFVHDGYLPLRRESASRRHGRRPPPRPARQFPKTRASNATGPSINSPGLLPATLRRAERRSIPTCMCRMTPRMRRGFPSAQTATSPTGCRQRPEKLRPSPSPTPSGAILLAITTITSSLARIATSDSGVHRRAILKASVKGASRLAL